MEASESFLKSDNVGLRARLALTEGDLQLSEAGKGYAEGKNDLLSVEITYLKAQIELYQVRLGLIIPVRVATAEQIKHEPVRKAREPFEALSSRVAKAQADANEEYWRKKAEAVDIAGVTSSESVTKDEADARTS